MKPLIGIVVRVPDKIDHALRTTYTNAIRRAGGIPVLIPVLPAEDFDRYVSAVDGFLIPGGPDVSPLAYGEEPHMTVTNTSQEVDLAEIDLVRRFIAAGKPIFGICRGHQVINTCLGGSLYQDINKQTGSEMCHRQSYDNRTEATHTVRIERDSHLFGFLGKDQMLVNSLHHQAVKVPGEGLRVVATALDGTVEALETADGMVVSVQWHPEELVETSEDARRIFEAFVARCCDK